jgi:hypothetical protein
MLDRDDRIDLACQVRQIREKRLAFRAVQRRDEVLFRIEPWPAV